MPVEFDVRDLYAIEAALDALESLHDGQDVLPEQRIRQCLCTEASSWRQARKVTVHWRDELGMKVRLLDRV